MAAAMGGGFLASIAGGFLGSLIAQQFFNNTVAGRSFLEGGEGGLAPVSAPVDEQDVEADGEADADQDSEDGSDSEDYDDSGSNGDDSALEV